MTPATNEFFKKKEHTGQKKLNKLELTTFSRQLFPGILLHLVSLKKTESENY